MNHYYQIPEENEGRRRRGGAVAMVVIAVVLLAGLAALLVWLASAKGPALVPVESDLAGSDPSESDPSESEVEPRETEEHPEETRAPSEEETIPDERNTDPVWEPEPGTEEWWQPTPEPGTEFPVKYYSFEEMEAWCGGVYAGLVAVKRTIGDTLDKERHQVGLFDFECDGILELVRGYESGEGAYCLEIYNFNGELIASRIFEEGTTVELGHRAMPGLSYPCSAYASTNRRWQGIYYEDYEMMAYNIATPGFEWQLIHSVTQIAGVNKYTDATGKISEAAYIELGETYGEANPYLMSTDMYWIDWTEDSSLYELADQLTGSHRQWFVKPAQEVHPELGMTSEETLEETLEETSEGM